jgi:hypothetical protein
MRHFQELRHPDWLTARQRRCLTDFSAFLIGIDTLRHGRKVVAVLAAVAEDRNLQSAIPHGFDGSIASITVFAVSHFSSC